MCFRALRGIWAYWTSCVRCSEKHRPQNDRPVPEHAPSGCIHCGLLLSAAFSVLRCKAQWISIRVQDSRQAANIPRVRLYKQAAPSSSRTVRPVFIIVCQSHVLSHVSIRPQSTRKLAPVANEALSDARNISMFTISCGCAVRFSSVFMPFIPCRVKTGPCRC